MRLATENGGFQNYSSGCRSCVPRPLSVDALMTPAADREESSFWCKQPCTPLLSEPEPAHPTGPDGSAHPCSDAAAETYEQDYIPIDYEAEIELCSQYTFSSGAYSPEASSGDGGTHQRYAANHLSISEAEGEACLSDLEEDEANAADVSRTPHSAGAVPFSSAWLREQQWMLRNYHACQRHRWSQHMAQENAVTHEQSVHGLRALVYEACRRDVQRLRQMPAAAFAQRPVMPTSLDSLPALLLPKDMSVAERRAFAVRQAVHQWRRLVHHLERELTQDPTRLDSLASSLRSMCIFSADEHCLVRRLYSSAVEENKRRRRERAEGVLRLLTSQNTLFLSQPLYAHEYEPPRKPSPIVSPLPVWSSCSLDLLDSTGRDSNFLSSPSGFLDESDSSRLHSARCSPSTRLLSSGASPTRAGSRGARLPSPPAVLPRVPSAGGSLESTVHTVPQLAARPAAARALELCLPVTSDVQPLWMPLGAQPAGQRGTPFFNSLDTHPFVVKRPSSSISEEDDRNDLLDNSLW